MNLKDRLVIAKQNEINSKISEQEKQNNISDIFSNFDDVESILTSYISNNKNIMFLADNSFEYGQLINFIHLLSNEKQLNLIDNPEQCLNNKLNLINITEINELVKVFQSIIMGTKPYIISFRINSSENIIEKLKTLIAINYQNLAEKHIDTLLSEADISFISIDFQQKLITEINELIYDDELYLNNVYSIEAEQEVLPQKNIVKTEKTVTSETSSSKIKNILIDDELMNYKTEEHMNNTENDIVENNIDEIKSSEKQEISNNSLKINKYKLLKEKVKAKKKS